jgi:glycosyltransferase involved in cell wall biosynthesis
MTPEAGSASLPDVAVIIPTTCEAVRAQALRHALASVLAQEGVRARPLLVVNGKRFDPALLEEMRARPELQVMYVELGSLPNALRIGRRAVDAPFFSFLDDDDEYLPGALKARVAPLLADAGLACTAANGYRSLDGSDRPMVAAAATAGVLADPLRALLGGNWLASCGGTYRSSAVTPDYFDEPAPYFEWTYLAYRLALELPMRYVDQPTFRIHESAVSLSKSEAYRNAEVAVLLRILQLPLPPDVARALRAKLGRVRHDLANEAGLGGRVAQAWKLHCQSLGAPGGLRYLAYTRKVLLFSLRRLAPA